MPDPGVVAFVRAALPPAPARVLEIGAGDGALAALLREAGHDVVAIDPGRADASGVERVALHELDAPAASFDAAVAIVSLHHVEPLEGSLARLAEVVRPGGALVVDELDVERFDERAARWLAGQWAAAGRDGPADHAAWVAQMRRDMHSVARLREALGAHFAVGEPVRGAYLHRWHVDAALRPLEEKLIAAGALPALGARLVGVRR